MICEQFAPEKRSDKKGGSEFKKNQRQMLDCLQCLYPVDLYL